MRDQSQINKSSSLPNGVCRFVEHEKRTIEIKSKIGFNALVYINGKKKIQKFRVTRLRSEVVACKLACDLRFWYEQCIEDNKKFTEQDFACWMKIH